MKLRKDDPVYYKKKIMDLIKQARENGLYVYMPDREKYICFKSLETGEIASSYIPCLFREGRTIE
ncbi:hypothetical protein ABHA37_08045 [Clostridium tertium]|uniref:hypothetical protein n=1 Tax=Clostridium tertium TaxID=1559 RepID=UPI00232CF7D0|nr:hypothetical protein [Clostridium tertium]MDB1923363.1 hypothetical protein [Clostridium tertium]MDB1929968.1 hypothetical protein [Clostridium tertium]